MHTQKPHENMKYLIPTTINTNKTAIHTAGCGRNKINKIYSHRREPPTEKNVNKKKWNKIGKQSLYIHAIGNADIHTQCIKYTRGQSEQEKKAYLKIFVYVLFGSDLNSM